jgi:peptidoglycan hydrolase CwlO-like protein
MDDTNDERSGDEEVEAAQDRSLSVIIDPSLIIPDQDTQILETWFHTFNLPTHVQELEQHLQQLEQHLQQIEDKVDALDERVSNISRQQFFHGRSIAAMIADILIHQGFDPVTRLPKN